MRLVLAFGIALMAHGFPMDDELTSLTMPKVRPVLLSAPLHCASTTTGTDRGTLHATGTARTTALPPRTAFNGSATPFQLQQPTLAVTICLCMQPLCCTIAIIVGAEATVAAHEPFAVGRHEHGAQEPDQRQDSSQAGAHTATEHAKFR